MAPFETRSCHFHLLLLLATPNLTQSGSQRATMKLELRCFRVYVRGGYCTAVLHCTVVVQYSVGGRGAETLLESEQPSLIAPTWLALPSLTSALLSGPFLSDCFSVLRQCSFALYSPVFSELLALNLKTLWSDTRADVSSSEQTLRSRADKFTVLVDGCTSGR